MAMDETSMLVDCDESLKHIAACYQQAAFQADSDRLRNILQDIAAERSQQQAAVFNLLHQKGVYKTDPADKSRAQDVIAFGKEEAQNMEQRRVDAGEALVGVNNGPTE